MAQLAVAAVGAAATTAIGLGPSPGWIAGSLIGGLLFAEDGASSTAEGPQLNDLSVTSSAYGVAIASSYGTDRRGGNVIWSSGIEELKNTKKEDTGGKGAGGSSTTTTVTYEYFGSFAVALGKGVMKDVLRIWADGKIIYDITGSTDDVQKVGLSFRFYPGSETQEPDGLIEAEEGVGTTPAFRGICYLVFDRLPLVDFGNRIPNITAEITAKARQNQTTTDANLLTASEGGTDGDFSQVSILPNYTRGTFYTTNSSLTNGECLLRRINSRTMVEDRQTAYTQDANGGQVLGLVLSTIIPNGKIITRHQGVAGDPLISVIDPDTHAMIATNAIDFNPLNGKSAYAEVLSGDGKQQFPILCSSTNNVAIYRATDSQMFPVWNSTDTSLGDLIEDEETIHGIVAGATGNDFGEAFILVGDFDMASVKLYRIKVQANASYDSDSEYFNGISIELINTLSAGDLVEGATELTGFRGLVYENTDESVMLQCRMTSDDAYMVKLDVAQGLVQWSVAIPCIKASLSGMNKSRITDGVYGQVDGNDSWSMHTADGTIFSQNTNWDRYYTSGSAWWDGKSSLYMGNSTSTLDTTYIQSKAISGAGTLNGLFMHPDGKHMVTASGFGRTRSFRFGTPWDISTIAETSFVSLANATSAYVRPTDGLKLVRSTNTTVYISTLTTAWEVSTLTGTTTWTPGIGDIAEVWMSADGTRLFMLIDAASATVVQYDLSIPWSFSGTKTLAGTSSVASGLDSHGMFFSDDYLTMYITKVTSPDKYAVYSLSAPADISTITFEEYVNFDLTRNNSPTDLWIQQNGRYSYTMFTAGTLIEQYETGDQNLTKWLFFRGAGTGETLDVIVGDLCDQAGLSASEYDVTDLSGIEIRGYSIGRTSTIRSTIAPLSKVYMFDGVESDYKLKYTLRDGKASETTITQDKLLAIGAKDYIIEDRVQEVELPSRFTLTYIDQDRDYLSAAHNAKRLLGPTQSMSSKNEMGISVPISMDADTAKQTAEKILYSSWIERSNYRFSLTWEYLTLDPSDVVTITLDDGTTYRTRLSETTFGNDMSIEIAGLSESAAQYTSTVLGDSGQIPEQEFASVVSTKLIILSSPLLRDRDDQARSTSVLYFLMGGLGQSGWTAASLLKSNEGTDYVPAGVSVSEMAWGTASSALGDVELWNQTDEVNTVTVYMNTGADELVSTTQLGMLNGANAAALIPASDTSSPEIFQFRDVATNDDGSLTLSGLLRGRRGTELFTGLHTAGDTFVLLDTADVESTLLPIGDQDLTRYYKAVTSGQFYEDAITTTRASPLNDLKPYAVTLQEATLEVGNDVTLDWVRQTRVGGPLKDGGNGEVPLSEDTEEYELEIFDGPAGTEIREVTGLTSPTYTYTSANQTTDGLSVPISSITIKVYQISAQVGRGFSEEITLNVQ